MVAEKVNELSLTEKAIIAFVDRARQIPDVSVYPRGSTKLSDSTVLIVVPDMLGPTADLVYALEVSVRKQYKRSGLRIDVQPREAYENEMRAD